MDKICRRYSILELRFAYPADSPVAMVEIQGLYQLSFDFGYRFGQIRVDVDSRITVGDKKTDAFAWRY